MAESRIILQLVPNKLQVKDSLSVKINYLD